MVPLTRVDARLGLSLLDFLEADALGGRVGLRPRLWTAVGLALPWGAAAGFLGGLLAQRVRRRGRAGGRPPRPPGEPPG
ncbi:hypothetical protein LUX05_23335 [Streptomyces somaliensis]|nr:hypothetical protein [Streptomyces somaliensis]